MQWGLRFTPTACTTMTVIALIYQLPWLAYIASCLGLLAFLLPSAHPVDLIYNHLVRKPLKTIALPANPLQQLEFPEVYDAGEMKQFNGLAST